jgi:phage tail-like protein
MAGDPDDQDPYLGCLFTVEIEGLLAGGFAEVSGLEIEIETESYREGGRNDMVHSLPVGATYGRLILQRGLVDSDVLWRWQSDVRNGKQTRHKVRITLRTADGRQRREWRVIDALPVKWGGLELKAGEGQVAMERLELLHNGLRSG